MAAKPGFMHYVGAAFNARPFGMFVAPNWIGLAAVGMLGVLNPGFWILGAGLELGYLLLLATNQRFQRAVASRPLSASRAEWNERINRLMERLHGDDRGRYEALAEALPDDHRSPDAWRHRGPARNRVAGRQSRAAVVDVSPAARRPERDCDGGGARRRPTLPKRG